MAIGRAVHAALAIWAVNNDEVKGYKAAFEETGGQENLEETVYAVLSGYYQKYHNDLLIPISTETEIHVPLTDWIEYGMRIDGLVQYNGDYWVLERKTSGANKEQFFKTHILNRQDIGYTWGCRVRYGLPVKGYVIDAMFKPNQKRHDPDYDRRFFTPTEAEIDLWYKETVQIAEDARDAFNGNRFYRSCQCFSRYNKECEFFAYCSNGENQAVLETTHQLALEENGK